jgi:hypothetical protein
MNPTANVDRTALVRIATEVFGWSQAHGGDTAGRFDALVKEVRASGAQRFLTLPALDLAVAVPAVDPLRHKAVPRGHSERMQGTRPARFWSFASSRDALLTVALGRIDGEDGMWSAHIGRGPLRQYLDRLPVPLPGGNPAAAGAPTAAPYALAVAEVLLPLQEEIERLGGPRKVPPAWDPTAVI